MTWLRILLIVIAGLTAALGNFALTAVLLSASYVILSWQYEVVSRELTDSYDFVNRLIHGDDT